MYLFIFFFKQKTAYEMRISDWSSDVCSSDLTRADVAIADMSWSVTEGLTFSTFATASDFRTLRFARLADGNARIDGREYTLEPRLRFGSDDDMLSGFIAAYAFRARQNEEIDLFGNGLFRDTTDTRAVFGDRKSTRLNSSH